MNHTKILLFFWAKTCGLSFKRRKYNQYGTVDNIKYFVKNLGLAFLSYHSDSPFFLLGDISLSSLCMLCLLFNLVPVAFGTYVFRFYTFRTVVYSIYFQWNLHWFPLCYLWRLYSSISFFCCLFVTDNLIKRSCVIMRFFCPKNASHMHTYTTMNKSINTGPMCSTIVKSDTEVSNYNYLCSAAEHTWIRKTIELIILEMECLIITVYGAGYANYC